MNGVAHYLFGLLITLFVIRFYHGKEDGDHENLFTPQVIVFIVVLTFFSHAVVDALAHFTYHPSESNWGDPVYAGWHLITYVAEAIFAIHFLRTDFRYAFGMLGSVGFDLWDWSTVRPLQTYAGIELPGIHFMADATQNFLFGSFQSLRNEQWALIIEVIVVVFLYFTWRTWHNNSQISVKPRKSSWKEVGLMVVIFGSLRLLTLI